jgi:hypothetical protein
MVCTVTRAIREIREIREILVKTVLFQDPPVGLDPPVRLDR